MDQLANVKAPSMIELSSMNEEKIDRLCSIAWNIIEKLGLAGLPKEGSGVDSDKPNSLPGLSGSVKRVGQGINHLHDLISHIEAQL